MKQHRSRALPSLIVSLALVALVACGDTSGNDNGPAETAGGQAMTAGAGPAGAGGHGGSAAAAMKGEPISAPDKQWTWVDFDDSKCRDGSHAGVSVSLNASSKKVMIYLEGGGACFDASTCAQNPTSVGNKMPAAAGVFDRGNAENPVADWNMVYVPYCTGDVHIGDAQDVMIPGVTGVQQFNGRKNLESFLARLVPTFHGTDQVLLTGVSAGGFGASANAEFVQNAFGSIPVTMIDDSGPGLSTEFVPGCLPEKYKAYWGIDKTVLALCGSDCSGDGDFTVQYAEHVAKKSTATLSGVIESNQDQVIRLFDGIATNNGADDCKGVLGLTPMDPKVFEAGLLDLRKRMQGLNDRFGTFYPTSMQHTWIGGASFYTATAGPDKVRMVDWFHDILTGKAAAQVGE
jgi:hypothetical protein